jgi:predicted NUDIX family NTP pyrophosphohydrolase
MAKRSAGVLAYRRRGGELQVLLVHPGGPFWVRKDDGAWSIPKGEIDAGEDAFAAARREFAEETGGVAEGEFLALGDIRQASGKIVTAWAVETDLDADMIRSNTCEVEYPPHSGKMRTFPEVDRAAWFGLAEARVKILSGQAALLERLAEKVTGKVTQKLSGEDDA